MGGTRNLQLIRFQLLLKTKFHLTTDRNYIYICIQLTTANSQQFVINILAGATAARLQPSRLQNAEPIIKCNNKLNN